MPDVKEQLANMQHNFTQLADAFRKLLEENDRLREELTYADDRVQDAEIETEKVKKVNEELKNENKKLTSKVYELETILNIYEGNKNER